LFVAALTAAAAVRPVVIIRAEPKAGAGQLAMVAAEPNPEGAVERLAGVLQCFQGGAGSRRPERPQADEAGQRGEDATRLAHGRKRTLEVDCKRIIAAKFADLVSDGAAAFLDFGTTVEAAAAEITVSKPGSDMLRP
jgi:hypothetical protein